MKAENLISTLQMHASDNDAIFLQRFFKTGPGEYGENDQFIGVRVPITRKVCREFRDLPLDEIKKLLSSPIHEHRLAATIIMSGQYKKSDIKGRQDIYKAYLKALEFGYINNWDIIDTSCPHIVGAWARDHGDDILFSLAKSEGIWQKRVAIVSCFAWIRRGEVGPTIDLAQILWREQHDLLQKATGWMLREVGKSVDESLLTNFLDDHAHEMPRTCLRYSLERLSPDNKKYYMSAKDRYLKK